MIGLFRLATVFLFSLAICSAPANAEQTRIAALINDTSNPYWKTLEDGCR